MASTSQAIISFIFQGEDKLSAEIDKMNLSFSSLASGLESATDPIANFTTGLLKTETAVAAAALALAGFAVNEAGKFDTSMRELTTLVNGGATELAAFGTTITKMGQTSAVSLDDLTGAMYKAVSQTGNLEDAAQAVNAAEKLAVAGRADLTDTTLLLVGTLASYGKGMDSAAKFSDVLFSVVQNGQTTLPELAAGLGNVAPTAAAAGVGIDELGAAIALLTKSGIGTSEAMTGVKAALSNIIAPSTEAQKTAAALGINFTTAGVASLGFAGFMTQVAEKTGGSTDKISALFGSVEAFNSVMVLSKNGGADFNAMLDSIKNGAGSTEKAYALMVETFTVKNQQLANNLKLVGIAFGSEVLTPVEHVQDALAAFLVSLQKSISAGAFDPLFAAARKALDNLATVIRQIAAIFPEAAKNLDFTQLLDAFADLAHVAGGLFDGIDLTTPEGLHKVLQTIIDTIETFVRVTTGVADILVPMVQQFGEWALAGNQLSPELKENVGQLLGLGTALNAVAPSLGLVAGAIDTLSLAFGVNGLVGAIKLAQPLLSSSAVSLIGQGGLVVAAGAAGYGLGTLADKFFGINAALTPYTEALAQYIHGPSADLIARSDEAARKIAEQAQQTGTLTAEQRLLKDATYANIPSFTELDDILGQVGQTYFELGDGTKLAADIQRDMAATVKTAAATQAQALDGLLVSWHEVGDVTRDATLSTDLAAKGFKVIKAGSTDLATGLHYTTQTITFTGESLDKLGDTATGALSKTAEETLKAQQAANDFQLQWEKLASDERQLIYKVSADIAIAQIEAGTKQVIAAFESVNTTIESTGNVLIGLAGILADMGSGSKAEFIIDLMEEENKRRQEALDLQKKLVESQVKYLDAVVARMSQGDAMIQITSDGLDVALEALMQEVLKKVQIKASSEAQQFLLGL